MPFTVSIDDTTPIGTDSPADAPTLFQDIKSFIVNVFGVTNGSTYTLPAFTINPTTIALSIDQAGFTVEDLTLAQGTITSAAPAVSVTSTWNSAGVTFDAFVMDVTVTAGQAASRLINLKADGTSRFYVQRTGDGMISGSLSIGSTVATTGPLRVANNVHLTARNTTNSADIQLIGTDGSNRVVLASSGGLIMWGTPRVSALAGTSAAVIGTNAIGAVGQPSNTNQNGWLKVVNSVGVTEYIPTWQ